MIKGLSELQKRQFSLGASNYGFNAGYNQNFENGGSANIGVNTDFNLKPSGFNAGYNHNFGNGFSIGTGLNTNSNLKPTGAQLFFSYRPKSKRVYY
jgi:hypothetical protein